MSTPDTPSTDPVPDSPADAPEGTVGAKGRPRAPSSTAGDVAAAGRTAETARSEEARTMRERVAQQGPTDSEAAAKVVPEKQGPVPAASGQEGSSTPDSRTQPTKRPVVTGTAASRAQQPAQGQTGDGRAGPVAATAAETSDAVDAPTSHISRSKVQTTGMTDLSAVSHPSTAAGDSARELSDARPRPSIAVGSRRGRGPLRASMQLRSIDPWSMLKISLLLSTALFFVWLVAVAIIYLVLDGMGVWGRLNTGVTDIMAMSEDNPTLIGPGQVFGVAAIIGIINVVLFTAMSTIGAFIYNMSADAVGGVEVTLADRD